MVFKSHKICRSPMINDRVQTCVVLMGVHLDEKQKTHLI